MRYQQVAALKSAAESSHLLKGATRSSLTSILSRLRERKQSIRYAIFMISAASFSPLVSAVETARPTFTPPPTAAVSTGSVLQVIVSLLLVLAAVVMVAWVLKRINLPQQGSGNALKVISGVAVGQRERVVLVEVNDTWLVVGVAPGQVNALHSMPKGSIPTQSNNAGNPSNDFQSWMKKMMEKRNA